MIEILFFDFDGVLVESVDIKTEAFARLFEPEGTEVVQAVVAHHLKNTGVSRFDKFHYIYKNILRRPLEDAEFQRLCASFALIVVDAVVEAPYVKGALEFLSGYSERYRCFVTSATPQEEMERIVEARGMGRFFRGIHGAPTAKRDAVRMTLAKERVEPSRACYIGDALSDYQAAVDTGVHFVARINGNAPLFAGINCPKIMDLVTLSGVIASL
jgi:HAD superfamily hydrolase (TIGR01549 family)